MLGLICISAGSVRS